MCYIHVLSCILVPTFPLPFPLLCLAPAPAPEPSIVPEARPSSLSPPLRITDDSDVMVTSSGKPKECVIGSSDMPVVIVDEAEEEIQGEDAEVISAFSGES